MEVKCVKFRIRRIKNTAIPSADCPVCLPLVQLEQCVRVHGKIEQMAFNAEDIVERLEKSGGLNIAEAPALFMKTELIRYALIFGGIFGDGEKFFAEQETADAVRTGDGTPAGFICCWRRGTGSASDCTAA